MAPRISDAEWEVLRVLWNLQEASGVSIVAALQETMPWKPPTIKTLLNRLVKKGVVGFRPDVHGYKYFPRVSQSECAARERRSFLDKVYGGDPRSMVAAFITEERLTPEDIEALRVLLDERGS